MSKRVEELLEGLVALAGGAGSGSGEVGRLALELRAEVAGLEARLRHVRECLALELAGPEGRDEGGSGGPARTPPGTQSMKRFGPSRPLGMDDVEGLDK